LNKNRPALILILLIVVSLFSVVLVSTAQAATTVNTSMSELSITPNPAGPGWQISIIGTISPPPPPGYSYRAIVFTLVDVNGNFRMIATNSTQPGSGTFYFSWIPDLEGAYKFMFTYPGETLAGDAYTRCQSNASFLIDRSLPTPSPSPISTQTPAPTQTPTPTPIPDAQKIQTTLNVNCQSSTTYNNFKVNIQGTLTANNAAVPNEPIQLSYSVNGGNSWEELTYLSTDATGAFQAVWTPSVTGNYFIKASYAGNSEIKAASTTVQLAVIPEDTSVLSVASNSTVSALAFNSTSQTLSFKVSGESGTTGYFNVYISKALMSDASKLKLYFDQELLQPTTQSVGDSWLVSFSYHHSMHSVALALNSDVSGNPAQSGPENLYYIVAGLVAAVLASVAVAVVLLKGRAKRSPTQ
jgi:hypothetical protein